MLIDRDRDLATLLAFVDDVARGDGRLVFLGGEAGVGKTSLVNTVSATVATQVTVRRGMADNFPTAAALGPLIDAFPDLEALMGDSEVFDRARLFRRVRAILSEAPTVLVLEDLHWADEATCDLLRFLGRRLDGLPALVIATFRDDEAAPYHPLSTVMGDLGGVSRVARMTLSRLTSAGVRQLVDAAGSAVDPDDVYRRTDGNPFFVTEILAAETEAVPRTISAAVLAIGTVNEHGNGRSCVQKMTIKNDGWFTEHIVGQTLLPRGTGASVIRRVTGDIPSGGSRPILLRYSPAWCARLTHSSTFSQPTNPAIVLRLHRPWGTATTTIVLKAPLPTEGLDVQWTRA